MTNPFDQYSPKTLKKYPFLKKKKYFEYVINLTPLQISEFGEKNIITLDHRSKEPFKVFLTNTQIKKVEKAKKKNKIVDLKFSESQFKQTLPYIVKLNKKMIVDRANEQLKIVKKDNSRKIKSIVDLHDRANKQLKIVKKKNSRKIKSIEGIHDIINLDKFSVNTIKKIKENRPPQKKN